MEVKWERQACWALKATGSAGAEGRAEILSRRGMSSVILEGYPGCFWENGYIGGWGAMNWKD